MKMVTATERVKLLVAEEQPIFRVAFESCFQSHPRIEMVGCCEDIRPEVLVQEAWSAGPDVILVGVKALQAPTVNLLTELRESCPGIGIVLLSAFCDAQGTKALREFFRSSVGGCAFLQKHTIDAVEQLDQVIQAVSQGRMIIDPGIMSGLVASGDSSSTLLKDLSPRELEVLSWMAKGYRNGTIAEVLCLEGKTVERHINNIYSKLSNCPDPLYPRVFAIMQYLKATGRMPDDPDPDLP